MTGLFICLLIKGSYSFNDSNKGIVRLSVGSLISKQQASASQGRICTGKFICSHFETEVANQTFYLSQSQYTDTG